MTSTPTLNGQTIGQAHLATKALLARALTEAGLDFESSVILNLVGGHGGSIPEPELVEAAANGLKMSLTEARQVLAGLVERGLVRHGVRSDDGSDGGGSRGGDGGAGYGVELTVAGTDRFQQLTASIAGITDRLYGDLPTADRDVTARVLLTVTARANAELAG
jgi:hypothetical protein